MINTLVFAGGALHDWQGCSEAIIDILSRCDEFKITKIEDDLDALTASRLAPYNLIVFYYTLGELSDAQKNGLLNHIASGKGFAGVHCAADSFRECPEYRAMIGGHFVTHPHYREYQVNVSDTTHPITAGIEEFMVTDEQYVMNYDSRVEVLAAGLWKGSTMPVVWTKNWGAGRVFYLALGHDAKACRQEIFATLLLRGALWAAAPGE